MFIQKQILLTTISYKLIPASAQFLKYLCRHTAGFGNTFQILFNITGVKRVSMILICENIILNDK